jgi:hypothetical protein
MQKHDIYQVQKYDNDGLHKYDIYSIKKIKYSIDFKVYFHSVLPQGVTSHKHVPTLGLLYGYRPWL